MEMMFLWRNLVSVLEFNFIVWGLKSLICIGLLGHDMYVNNL